MSGRHARRYQHRRGTYSLLLAPQGALSRDRKATARFLQVSKAARHLFGVGVPAQSLEVFYVNGKPSMVAGRSLVDQDGHDLPAVGAVQTSRVVTSPLTPSALELLDGLL